DPVQVPGAVGHGGRRIISKAGNSPVLFTRDGNVPKSSCCAMVVVEHFLERDDFQRLENVGSAGDLEQSGRILGHRRSNHKLLCAGRPWAEPVMPIPSSVSAVCALSAIDLGVS